MSAKIETGTTIERYRVERPIGSGSMGDVFLGMDISLDRKVALKILSERHRENRELRARFVREAKAVAAISHPNVVQVFTTGSFDGRPYIAMEFLDGTDLGSSVQKGGSWSSLQSANAALDAARGLNAAAQAGLIHRDVKPSNLVLLRDGSVKVTDFGLAKPIDADQPALTALGVVVGTPDYIAPEQARGEPIDHRVDIYALGGTLFYLLTGIPPFRTGRPKEDKYLKVVARHLKNPAPDPCKRNPVVDKQLGRLTRRMMAKDPDERPDYDVLVDQLTAIAKRVERELGGDAGSHRHHSGFGGQVSPTPVVHPSSTGNPEPNATVQMTATQQAHAGKHVHRSSQGHRLSQGGAPVSTGSGAVSDSRVPTTAASRPWPNWLVMLTVISALVFAVGGSLKLFGPIPDAPPAESRSPVSGDSTTDDRKPPTHNSPTLPRPGMIRVSRPDGSPWFDVAAHPVSYAAYASMFPQHPKPPVGAEDKPVTGVSYRYAQTYAEASNARLPTAEEWDAAAKAIASFGDEDLWEWIAHDEDSTESDQKSVRSAQGTATRPAPGARDVTFRLVSSP